MLRLGFGQFAVLVLAGGALVSSAFAQTPAAPAAGLAPAARFVDPVSVYGESMSPSGASVAYIQRNAGGEQIVVVDLDNQRGRAIQSISADQGSFNWVIWKSDSRLVVSATLNQTIASRTVTGSHLSTGGGSFSVNRVFALNSDGTGVVQMFQNQTRQLLYGYGSTIVIDDLPDDPNHVLIGASEMTGNGVWRGDLTTGQAEKILDGQDTTRAFVTDAQGTPVLRQDSLPDGSGFRIYRRPPQQNDWTLVTEVRRSQAAHFFDFDPLAAAPGVGKVYVLARPEGANFASIYIYDTASGQLGEPLQQDTVADAGLAWINPRTHALIATCEDAVRPQCRAADPAMQRNLNALDAFFEHQATVSVVDMSQDGRRWLLAVDGPTDPGGVYVFDLPTHSVSPVADRYPNLDNGALSPVRVENFQARDGAQLWAYVTEHPGAAGPRPMVVLPHGGPEARDEYGYDALTQFLASRGYVVLQPNFRGSEGFGRAFAQAGHGQWGKLMQDDVTDAVHHMIDAGVADPARICIVGASYGGYAALAGVALTPDLYKCAVSIAGLSDLSQFLHTAAAPGGRGTTLYQYWATSIGPQGGALDAVSPRRLAARIQAPVLLIHGEADVTVLIEQSEWMQQALNGAGHPTRLIRIEGEDHYWNSWSSEHRLKLLTEVDAFLAQYLGPAAH